MREEEEEDELKNMTSYLYSDPLSKLIELPVRTHQRRFFYKKFQKEFSVCVNVCVFRFLVTMAYNKRNVLNIN